jgi:sec-independent protein translocase protein TatA
MFGLGTTEIIIIVVVIVVIFGAAKLPELGRNLGAGIRDFQKGIKGEDEEPKKLPEEEKKKELTD